MNVMKKLSLILIALLLTACAGPLISKVEPGEQLLGDRLQVTLRAPWNQMRSINYNGPHGLTWTSEGLSIDDLMIFTGVRDGEALHPIRNPKLPVYAFRANMKPDQIATLFESFLSRDGSTFTLKKLAPAPFAGGKGFRMEFSVLSKFDHVEISGVLTGIVDKGQFYGIMYQAPKLVFFPRHLDQVMQITDSARFIN